MPNKYNIQCTSFPFPPTIFNSGYMINPTEIPVAILDVNGMVRITAKAGKASSNDFQSILDNPSIMKHPTIINTGDVIAGMFATI